MSEAKRTRKPVDFKTRCCLFYEFKNEVSAVDASRKIGRAFGAGTISPEAAAYWYKKFKAGNENIDEARSAGATDGMNDSTVDIKPKKPRAPRKKKSEEVANQQAESSGPSAPKQPKLESVLEFAAEASKPKPKKPRKKKSDQQQVSMETVQPQAQPLVPMQVQGFEATSFIQLQPLTSMQQFTYDSQPLMSLQSVQPQLMVPVQESEHTIKVEMSECGYLQPKLEAMAEADKENSQTEEEWEDANQELPVEDVNVEDECVF
ncbi:HTH-48 domain-containing protein [Aphelenchoides besseyi]|nr:HTH-48 domain-containing protein [Aphelenchoides besseyi]